MCKRIGMRTANTSIKVLLVVALMIAFLYPLIEMVDVWDGPGNIVRTGSDTELDILLLLLFFSFLVAVVRLVLFARDVTDCGPLVKVNHLPVFEPMHAAIFSARLHPLRI